MLVGKAQLLRVSFQFSCIFNYALLYNFSPFFLQLRFRACARNICDYNLFLDLITDFVVLYIGIPLPTLAKERACALLILIPIFLSKFNDMFIVLNYPSI